MGFKVRCLRCGDIIESKWLHDFVSCSCGKVAVDGGNQYLRVCGNYGDWELISHAEDFSVDYATKMKTVKDCLAFTDLLTKPHENYWNPSTCQIFVLFTDASVFVADVDKMKRTDKPFYSRDIVGYSVIKNGDIEKLAKYGLCISKKDSEGSYACRFTICSKD